MRVQDCAIALKIIGISFVVIGAAFSWSTFGTPGEIGSNILDFVIWPSDGGQSYAAVETRLLGAIAGGLTSGLGVAIYMVAKEVYPSHPAVGRRILMNVMLVWFAIDSIGSVVAGGAYNVIPNLLFLMTVIGPLQLAKANESK